MKYNVTKNYIKTKEDLIAAFSDLNDAEDFIAKKLAHDEINRTKVLYRIYDDNEVVREFNHQIPTLIEAEDAETYSNAKFSFNVQVKAANSLERITIAYFNDEKDANLFVADKCSREELSGFGSTFLIFKDQVLFDTLNSNVIENKALKDQGASGKGTGVTLSPLSGRPTPPGGPQDYWVEKNDDE